MSRLDKKADTYHFFTSEQLTGEGPLRQLAPSCTWSGDGEPSPR